MTSHEFSRLIWRIATSDAAVAALGILGPIIGIIAALNNSPIPQ